MNTAINNYHPFLQGLTQDFPFAVIAWDEQMQIVYWNKAAEHIFERDSKQALGRSFKSVFKNDDHENIELLLAHLKVDKTTRLHSKTTAGEDITTEWRPLPASAAENSPLTIVLILDISIQIQHEYESKLAIRSFDELAEHLNNFIYVHDLEGNFTRVNNSITRALDYTREEFLQLNIFDVVVPAFHNAIRNNLQNKLSGASRNNHYEIMVKKRNDEEVWVEISNRLVYVDNKPVAIQGIAHDINDRKLNEAEMERNKKKFRGIFETIDDIYFQLDHESGIDLVSPSVYTHLGYQTEELKVIKIEKLYANPGIRNEILAYLFEEGHINDYEIHLRHKNNTIIPFSVSARVIYNQQGQAQGIEGIARNITQRKQHEEILKTNEQRFRRIFETIQDVYFRAENTIIRFVSPSCKNLLGYNPEEMIGHQALEFYNKLEEREVMMKVFRRQGYLTDYEIDFRHKNGNPVSCSLNLNNVTDENGKPVTVEGSLRDITTRKLAEKALRASEQQFRRIFESFQDTYYEADMNGIITILSPSVEVLYGFKPEEMVGKPATAVYADPKQRDGLVKVLTEKGYVNDYELMLLSKHGSLIPTSCSTRLVFDDTGTPVAVQGVLRDITERKKSDAALRNSEARFRSIFNSIPDAFLEINNDDIIVNASPSVSQFNYLPEQLTQSSISILFNNHDDWLNIKEKLERDNEIQDQECVINKNSDQSVPVSITAYKINNDDLTFSNSICIIRDISDSKRYEHELELARDQALEASRAKSAFLANMSHELRTPLNAIIGYSEMLSEDAEEAGNVDMLTDLKKIHASGIHLLSVIRDILDLSKIEAGKVEINIEAFSITTLIDEIMPIIAPLAKKNGNTLTQTSTLTDDIIKADPVKLKQSLFNLLSNACKFTQQGNISLNISQQTIDEKNWIVFRVYDTGIGITSEQMKKLFNEFSQADSTTTRQYGGTGLGLVISQRFCQLMGGNIEASSEYGSGSVFTIKLPACRPIDTKQSNIS